MNDYPTDIYTSIYNKFKHEDFPINGCWQLSNNSKKAIEKLNFHICTQGESDYHYPSKGPIQCDLCNEIGFECCGEYTGYEMRQCDDCSKTMCGKCCDNCGYCSDPNYLKGYYCYKCSMNCEECEEVICNYCREDPYVCQSCDEYIHERCKENHCCENDNNNNGNEI